MGRDKLTSICCAVIIKTNTSQEIKVINTKLFDILRDKSLDICTCSFSHLSSLANSRCWYGITPVKLLQDLWFTWDHNSQSSAIVKIKPLWKWHLFWERLFWKWLKGEGTFLVLQPVGLGLGVKRWAIWSLSEISASCVLPWVTAEDLGVGERKNVVRLQEHKHAELA